MGGAASWLFDTAGLTAHGFCLTWRPELVWLHAAADTAIALAYLSIPLLLVRFLRHRPDLRHGWIGWLFSAFILACGTTHALDVVTLWLPVYGLEGLVKLLTAALSLGAALALYPLLRRLVALPSSAQVEGLNAELGRRVIEQEQVAARLRENETRLRLAQEAGRIGSFDWDLDAGEGLWSDTQHALYGTKPSHTRVTSAAWLIRIHPNDRDAAMAALMHAWRTGQDYTAEFRVLAQSGELRWLAERGRLVEEASARETGGGPIRRILGVTVDVTERKGLTDRLSVANQLLEVRAAAHQHALEVASEQQRILFENSPDAMFILRIEHHNDGQHFVYDYCNPALETLLSGLIDRTAEDFVGHEPHDCFPPDIATEVVDAYTRCVETGERLTFRSARRIHGAIRQMETLLAPVFDPATGRVSRIIGAGRDVTEQVETECQLRLLQKIEVTGRLTAGVAHDFNNLLQALLGGLEMLDGEVAELPAAREYAQVALQAARRGAELTHRLLAFSRQQTLQPRPVALRPLLEAVRTLMARTLDPRIAITVEVAGEPAAFVDPAQLEAALLNLALNARDAMPDGGELRIAAAVSVAPELLGLSLLERCGRYIVLSMEDTGCGMAAAVLAQACEPFFTTKGPNGSGLGLSMVQGFARQSGGDIRLQSAPGEGTRVALWLPEAAAAPSADTTAIEPPRGRGRVLLVDDAPDVLVTAGAFLRQSGFTVVQVGSGDAALALLRQERRFDAVVTDYAMPGLNGLDLIRLARTRQPGLPAMIVTGFGAIDLESDADDISLLRKPFGRETLLHHVRAMLEPA